jgi:hypothetical protein
VEPQEVKSIRLPGNKYGVVFDVGNQYAALIEGYCF